MLRKVAIVYQDEVAKPEVFNAADTGADLKSSVDLWIPAKGWATVPTGTRLLVTGQGPVDIQIRGRSGLASKGVLSHVGTVDAGYRGELKVILFNFRDEDFKVSRGDRVCQIVIPPMDHLVYETDVNEAALDAVVWGVMSEEEAAKVLADMDENEILGDRGVAGFGSTGGTSDEGAN